MENDKYMLSSVSNTLKLLDLLAEHDELSLAEIKKMLPYGKGSIFKMLYTLEKCGYIIKSSEAKYCISYKFAKFGDAVLERHDLLKIARPMMRDLCEKTKETVHLATLTDDHRIVFIWKELSKVGSIQMASKIGVELPSYCTAVGKMLLASLPGDQLEMILDNIELRVFTANTIRTKDELRKDLVQVRKRSYAVDMSESEVGLTCFASLVKGIHGKVHAALSISGPMERMIENQEQKIEMLLTSAREISKSLGCEKY